MLNANKNEKKADIKMSAPEKVKVTRANQLDNGTVMFDVIVNDNVRISGMSAKPYENENGSGVIINFPSRKGSNGNWYDIIFFPINQKLKADIINQIDKITG